MRPITEEDPARPAISTDDPHPTQAVTLQLHTELLCCREVLSPVVTDTAQSTAALYSTRQKQYQQLLTFSDSSSTE
jgi:hypothetical protein